MENKVPFAEGAIVFVIGALVGLWLAHKFILSLAS